MGKPTPTHLRLLKGNPSRRPINKKEPKPLVSIPDAPSVLDDDARAEWDRLVPALYAMGLITELDRGALAAYCQSYGLWEQASKSLLKMAENDELTGGLLIKTTNGNAIQNPLVGIRNKAAADMVRYAAEFGMTPSARSRIEVDGAQGQDDPAAKYLA